MIVYHGSDLIVSSPDVVHSFRPLDFGKGFYVTTNRELAIHWARRKTDIKQSAKAYLNIFEMKEDDSGFKVKGFPDDLNEWIDFVCDCREGGFEYQAYDIIKGKVANDKVFRVVDLYHAGIWDKERALAEIKVYPGYDQIAFITQRAVDEMLTFMRAEEV